MDQNEILSALRDRGIYAGKRKTGQIKQPCPQCSPKRRKKGDPCLSVNLDKGAWLCHHCGWTGGVTGGEPDASLADKPKIAISYQHNFPDFNQSKWPLDEEVIEAYAERGITETTLRYYHIGCGSEYMPQTQQEEFVIAIPNYVGGLVVNVKYRGVDEKIFKQTKDCERTFYGLDDLFDDGRLKYDNVFIVEGEIDKWSCTEAGYLNVLSVPDGAPSPESQVSDKKFEYLQSPTVVELLKQVKTITIAVDNDAAGHALASELSRRIGVERCFQVFWPEGCKDANDVLMQEGPSGLVKALEARKPYPVEGIITVTDILPEVLRRYDGTEQTKMYSFGYGEGFDKICSLVGGQLWTVTGPPNSGKSVWLASSINSLITDNSDADFRCGWFTPESWPLWKHISKLVQLRVNKPFGLPDQPDRMTREELERAAQWVKQHHFYLSPEDNSVDGVLRSARAMVLQYGIKLFVFDPWNRFRHDFGNMSETNYIAQQLDKFSRFAQRNGCDVFLVAHPRKLEKYSDNHRFEGRYKVATAYDIAGSAHFFNISDNILSVWRDPQDLSIPVELHIQKGRDLEQVQTGVMATFDYDRRSGRYSYLTNSLADAGY